MNLFSEKLLFSPAATQAPKEKGFRLRQWLANVNWYRAGVGAFAAFAIGMDLTFPPVRVRIGEGLDIYAGHAYIPIYGSGTVEVDFAVLAIELAVIVAAAIVGWYLGRRERDTDISARGNS